MLITLECNLRTHARLFLYLLIGSLSVCQAQTISIIVPYTAGGVTDRVARVLEKTLTQRLPYNFVIEYQTGAGGIIAANTLAKNKSKETVLLVHSSAIVTNAFNSNSTYDIVQDFTPVARMGSLPMVLVANRNRGITTFKQLSETRYPIFYSTNGIGTANHVAGEILRQQINKDLIPVFYKGESVAFNDVLNNTVPLMFTSVSLVASYVNSNQISILAVTGKTRNESLPLVPTFAEQKIQGFDQSPNWSILLANAGADSAIISKIKNALIDSFSNSLDRELYKHAGLEPNSNPTTNVKEFINEELHRMKLIYNQLQLQK